MITSAVDTYGIKVAKIDGTNTKQFMGLALPRELPEESFKSPVQEFQMDEGLNHPGYKVRYTRTVDDSYKEYKISLGYVLPVDITYLKDLRQNNEQLLISWKSGETWQAVWQEEGLIVKQYPLNIREFGRVDLGVLIQGPSSISI